MSFPLRHTVTYAAIALLLGIGTLITGTSSAPPMAEAAASYPPPVNTPSNLMAQLNSPQTISLNWQDNARNETYQQIWISSNGSSYTKLADIPANVIHYQQDLAKPATAATLYYAVRAVSPAGTSGFARTKITVPATTAETTPGNRIAEDVLNAVNTFRAQNGLPPLTANSLLQAAAQRHSDNMASHSAMSHTCADGTTFDQRISQAGYTWHSIAENVAAGQPSAKDVVQAWINSPPHRSNMLKTDIKDAGIGFNNRYWTLDLAG